MSKQNTLEGVYDGLLEAVRRVDNFPKPKSVANKLSVEDILAMIDGKLVEYKQDYESLNLDSDDLEIGVIVGYIGALDSLKRDILELKDKGVE